MSLRICPVGQRLWRPELHVASFVLQLRMGMKLPVDINVITDVTARPLHRRVGVPHLLCRTCADASLGSSCPDALQFVLTWSMAALLARCHGGRRLLSLKFDFLFVPVMVLPSSFYSILTCAIPRSFFQYASLTKRK